MENVSFLKRATHSSQYDLDDSHWDKEIGVDSTRNFFYWEYLKNDIKQWKGKRVFEIGAGSGWLLQLAIKAGAADACGIEPASKGVELARKMNPDILILQETLEVHETGAAEFDVVLSVMVFSHIADIAGAFKKVRSLLSRNGEAIIIVPDFEYFRLPQKDYVVDIQNIDSHQYVAQLIRPSGTIADIIRTNNVYIEAAQKEGLTLVNSIPMIPTDAYLARAPKFAQSKEYAISQMLRFTVAK